MAMVMLSNPSPFLFQFSSIFPSYSFRHLRIYGNQNKPVDFLVLCSKHSLFNLIFYKKTANGLANFLHKKLLTLSLSSLGDSMLNKELLRFVSYFFLFVLEFYNRLYIYFDSFYIFREANIHDAIVFFDECEVFSPLSSIPFCIYLILFFKFSVGPV
jgi:hypothetical protein